MLTYELYPRVLQVLGWISQGYTRTKACNGAGISVKQFTDAVRADKELMSLFEEANVLGDDALFDALLDPEVNPLINTTDPKKLKVYSDNIKWVLARRNRDKFGDQVNVKQDVTIAFSITDELEKARARSQQALPPVDDKGYIDVEFYEVSPTEDDITELLG